MEIDHETATRLGWPKPKYAWVERERRWIAAHIPYDRVVRIEAFADLYVTGTQLRLREAVPADGGEPMRRLGRKADVASDVRLLTSIYLSESEHALLSRLPGRTLRKTRHYLGEVDGVVLSVDRFQAELEGLILAEAEFDSMEAMRAYPMPNFCIREVTDDLRYTGGALVADGLPPSV